MLYWDLIDRAGHDHGPGSPEFAAACKRSLDEVWDAVWELRGVTVLITADHGQVDVSPERVDYLDDLWPAAELFDAIGPRLRDRLGDVAVLPAAGRQAWLRRAAASEQRFRGQHRGLDEAETSTYLAQLTR